jgi:hypothetical protein
MGAWVGSEGSGSEIDVQYKYTFNFDMSTLKFSDFSPQCVKFTRKNNISLKYDTMQVASWYH